MPQILKSKDNLAGAGVGVWSDSLNLFVRSRTKTYFQGRVKSVSSLNQTGAFDILPMHANFITLITKYLIIDRTLPTEKKIEFDSAVVSAIGGKVDVYVGV